MVKITVADPQDFSCTDVLFQTSFWGTFKERINGFPSLYFWVSYSSDENPDEQKIFSLLVQIRHTKGNTVYAYSPRSPAINVPESERSCLLEQVAFALKEHLPKNTVFVRFDIPWGVPGVADVQTRPEMMELAMNFGTEHHNLKKSASNHFCPNTVIIDLVPSPEKILSSMRQQTRNSIRRAYREEVEFTIYDAKSPLLLHELEDWHKIYKETAERKGFYYEKFEYFKELFESSLNFYSDPFKNPRFESKSGVPMDACVPCPKFYLFTAAKDSKILSGLVLAICGKTAYYMYAASSVYNREAMPNYGLQWEVIRFARSKGCTKYDLMGIPANSDKENFMAGLYIFKTGFGGRKVHLGGTWDFPYDGESYTRFAVSESLQLRG